MHKNENGFGTIQDLGKKRRKRYAVRVTVGWIDGIQIRPYLGTFERRADAKKLLMQYGSGSPEERDRMLQAALSSKRSNKAADIVAAKQQRICTALPLNITLRDLYDRWKNTSSYKNLSVKTKGNYENAFSYLAPLHDEEFRDIKTSVLQDILDDLEVRHASHLGRRMIVRSRSPVPSSHKTAPIGIVPFLIAAVTFIGVVPRYSATSSRLITSGDLGISFPPCI